MLLHSKTLFLWSSVHLVILIWVNPCLQVVYYSPDKLSLICRLKLIRKQGLDHSRNLYIEDIRLVHIEVGRGSIRHFVVSLLHNTTQLKRESWYAFYSSYAPSAWQIRIQAEAKARVFFVIIYFDHILFFLFLISGSMFFVPLVLEMSSHRRCRTTDRRSCVLLMKHPADLLDGRKLLFFYDLSIQVIWSDSCPKS
jgi:hypothetical protein